MPKEKNLLKNKTVLIIHFRVGKTDGVSLEISSWKDILESAGATVELCAGPHSIGADYIIDNLEQQLNPIIYQIDENAFGGIKDLKSGNVLIKKIKKQSELLRRRFNSVFSKANPDFIIVSNIFSVGEGLPVAPSLTRILDKYKIKTISVNHDFYWENSRYNNPTNSFVEKIINKYFPPKREYIKHCCINSIGQEALWLKKGIKADLLFDTFDFRQNKWRKKPSTTKFLESKNVNRNDIVFLQATRVVRRKNIELSIDLINEISDPRHIQKLMKKPLYDGRNFDAARNKLVLLLSGYVEQRDKPYLEKLIQYARKKSVSLVYLGSEIDKEYCLWDIYPYADIITYPSEYEGFGNQLLEAFFARKPIAVFEYPVYKINIKTRGFDIISLGDKLVNNKQTGFNSIPQRTLQKAAKEITEILTSNRSYTEIISRNYKLGDKYFSHRSRAEGIQKDVYNGITEKNYEIGSSNFSYENAFQIFQRILR